jgi:hypothetical protein
MLVSLPEQHLREIGNADAIQGLGHAAFLMMS